MERLYPTTEIVRCKFLRRILRLSTKCALQHDQAFIYPKSSGKDQPGPRPSPMLCTSCITASDCTIRHGTREFRSTRMERYDSRVMWMQVTFFNMKNILCAHYYRLAMSLLYIYIILSRVPQLLSPSSHTSKNVFIIIIIIIIIFPWQYICKSIITAILLYYNYIKTVSMVLSVLTRFSKKKFLNYHCM